MEEAIEYLEKAIELCNDPYQKVTIMSDTGIVYSYKAASTPATRPELKTNYFTLANQRFMDSTQLDPRFGKAWLRWSQSLYREGRYADAWEKLQQARALDVSIPTGYEKKLNEKLSEPERQ